MKSLFLAVLCPSRKYWTLIHRKKKDYYWFNQFKKKPSEHQITQLRFRTNIDIRLICPFVKALVNVSSFLTWFFKVPSSLTWSCKVFSFWKWSLTSCFSSRNSSTIFALEYNVHKANTYRIRNAMTGRFCELNSLQIRW